MMDSRSKTAQRELAKEIILEIVRASGGKLDGSTRLYKAFLIAHLFCYRDSSRLLSDWPIVHMPNGHGIDEGEMLLRELVAEGRLQTSTHWVGPFRETRFMVAKDGADHALGGDERRAIRKTARFVKGKSGKELSDLVHEHSRSYKQGKSGEELNIYIDILSDEEYDAQRRLVSEVSAAVDSAFAQ